MSDQQTDVEAVHRQGDIVNGADITTEGQTLRVNQPKVIDFTRDRLACPSREPTPVWFYNRDVCSLDQRVRLLQEKQKASANETR
jgi:hypothetical protein